MSLNITEPGGPHSRRLWQEPSGAAGDSRMASDEGGVTRSLSRTATEGSRGAKNTWSKWEFPSRTVQPREITKYPCCNLLTFVGTGGAFLERCNKVGGINTPSHPTLYGLEHFVQTIVQFLLCNSCSSVLTFVWSVLSLSGDRAEDPNTMYIYMLCRVHAVHLSQFDTL